MARTLRLVSIDPFSPALDLVITRLPAIVGSNGTADVHIENRWIAKTHCEFCTNGNGRLSLRRLDRKMVTLLNGEPLTGKTAASVELCAGDELTLGVRTFEIHLAGAEVAEDDAFSEESPAMEASDIVGVQ